MIQDVIEKGVGETNLTVTIEGRNRFPIRVRYAPEFRRTPEAIGNIPVSTPSGATVPLANLAEIRQTEGAAMINSENGLLRGTVLLNVRGRDIGSVVDEAKEAIAKLPPLVIEILRKTLAKEPEQRYQNAMRLAEDLAVARWPHGRHPFLLETSLPGVFAVCEVRGGSV